MKSRSWPIPLLIGIIGIVGIISFVAPVKGAAGSSERVVLSPGRSIEWKAPRGQNISLSNGAIVRLDDLGNKIKVTARKKGAALIKSGDSSLEVDVIGERLYRSYEELNERLRDRRGLELRARGERVEIVGRLLRLEDWTELIDGSKTSDTKVVFSATMIDSIREDAVRHFNRRLRSASLPDLPMNFSPTATVIVPAEPKSLAADVARVMNPLGFEVRVSPKVVELEPLVRVRILVAEIRRHALLRFGIKWPIEVTSQVLAAGSDDNGQPIDVALQALEEDGMGKILASPTILCRSGKEAQFLAGGEFPIKIANFKTHDVIWKRHGVLLRINPVADASGRMSIGIETEVSMIDPDRIVDGIPGMLTNRIQTHFDLSESRTIALSGLIKKQWGKNSAGLPGLVKLPILGPLFGSREFIEEQSELIVFVTPEIDMGKSQ